MQDINSIRKKIADMALLALKMWRTTHKTFMEHDAGLIAGILEDEHKLNDLEKEVTTDLIELGRTANKKEEKANAIIYADIVGDLELIGDYCKDILERVQIKIEEELLFSEDAVKEYNDLYKKAEDALDEIACALERDRLSLAKEMLKKQENIEKLVDEYRRKHDQRLIDGICSPLACNMFLNMLDFTAAVYYHTQKIAKNLLKIK